MTLNQYDPALVAKLGPAPAMVHGVLLAHDRGQGVAMTRKDLAERTGLTETTVKRAVSTLVDAGIIKAEGQYGQGHQRANLYTMTSTSGSNSTPAEGQNDPVGGFPYSINTLVSNNNEYINKVLKVRENLPEETVPVSGNQVSDPEQEVSSKKNGFEVVIEWLPWNSPCPTFGPGTPEAFRNFGNALWLVSVLEPLVFHRENLSRALKGWKTLDTLSEGRKKKWLHNIQDFLKSTGTEPLLVSQVISWVFSRHQGDLPLAIELDRETNRRVTRFAVISENWEDLLELFEASRPATEPERLPITRKTVMPLREHVTPEQIDALVEMFAATQHHPRSQQDRDGWAKSFGIMVTNDGVPYADLHRVLANWDRVAITVDVAKYFNAFDIRTDWDYLGSTALKFLDALDKREKATAPSEEPSSQPDLSDYVAAQPVSVPAIGMTNVDERRSRYLARAQAAQNGSVGVTTPEVASTPVRSPWRRNRMDVTNDFDNPLLRDDVDG